MTVPFHVVIPARHASERLPGKVLAEIAGKPMIVHVRERALESGAASVTVATDDARVADAVRAVGGDAVMTSPSHRQGTERVAEAASLVGLEDDAIVVNLQGDEPLLPGSAIARAAAALHAHPRASVATLAEHIESVSEFESPDIVKVVLDGNRRALLFSREPIPHHRGAVPRAPYPGLPWLRHVGVYAYRHAYLRELLARAPVPLEECEKLEQLRTLHHGETVQVEVLDARVGPGVDTRADLDAVRRLFADEAAPP